MNRRNFLESLSAVAAAFALPWRAKGDSPKGPPLAPISPPRLPSKRPADFDIMFCIGCMKCVERNKSKLCEACAKTHEWRKQMVWNEKVANDSSAPTNPAPTSSSHKPASGPASGDSATKPTPANG